MQMWVQVVTDPRVRAVETPRTEFMVSFLVELILVEVAKIAVQIIKFWQLQLFTGRMVLIVQCLMFIWRHRACQIPLIRRQLRLMTLELQIFVHRLVLGVLTQVEHRLRDVHGRVGVRVVV